MLPNVLATSRGKALLCKIVLYTVNQYTNENVEMDRGWGMYWGKVLKLS